MLRRCHSVHSRPHQGGNIQNGKLDIRLRIIVVPLADLDLVHGPHKEEDTVLSDVYNGEVGGRGGAGEEARVVGGLEGLAGTASLAAAMSAWEAPPSNRSTLPTTPFPTKKTWSMLEQSELDKSIATARVTRGGVPDAWCWAGVCGPGGLGSRSYKVPYAAHPWNPGAAVQHQAE